MKQNDQKAIKETFEDYLQLSKQILELYEIEKLIKDLQTIKGIFRNHLQTSLNIHNQQTIESMWKYYLEGLETVDDLKGFVKILKDKEGNVSEDYVLSDTEANKNSLFRDFAITQDQERKGSI